MIPLRDENPTGQFPLVTVLLIGLNCLVFGYEVSLSMQSPHLLDNFINRWGFIPGRFQVNGFLIGFPTLFTSMFLHGGFLHLGSNMLYLWVFGDNIEEELGHGSFLLFYLSAGMMGTLSQFLVTSEPKISIIGASGAIAGVLGAYLFLYPTARVLTAVIFVIFVRLVYLPAWILLGFWIFLQLLQGTAALGAASAGGSVAWFAHIGGFGAGAILVFLLRN